MRCLRIFMLLVVLLSLAGCGQGAQERGGASAGDASDDTIVLAAYRQLAPGVNDGYYCSKILGVWEPLVTADEETGAPAPCLAASWEMLDEGRVWVFHLREGVRFHDGTPLTAQVVADNLAWMEKEPRSTAFYSRSRKNYYPGLVSAEPLDTLTLRLTFAQPNINQLYNMMNFGSPVYAPSCLADDGNFAGVAIGTGPFRIVENVKDRYVLLERNEDYYGEKARAHRIMVRSIPSPDVRFAALKAEEIMGVLDLGAMPPVLADELAQDERFAISTSRSIMVRYLAMNGTRPPFDDVRMRRAVSLLLDRRLLVDALYLGYATPTMNLLSIASPFYKEFPVVQDVEEAKRLAHEVLGDGRREIVYCVNGADPIAKGEAELIAYWLADLGLDVRIEALESPMMTVRMRRGDYDIARSQQGLPNGDPLYVFDGFFSPQGPRNKALSLGYDNAEVNRLLAALRTEPDEGKRRAVFDRIQAISVEEQPLVPLYYDENIVVYNAARLTGYRALRYGVSLAEVAWR